MRRSSLVISLVVGALLVPVAVFASHQFNDVPDSHIFHTGISWMKDNNITVGCNPPANNRYCPEDNVTRGQMATFMKRLAENNVVDAATLDGLDSTDFYTKTQVDTDFYTKTQVDAKLSTSGSVTLGVASFTADSALADWTNGCMRQTAAPFQTRGSLILPVGVTITRMNAWVIDNNATNSTTTLRRVTGFNTIIATATTSGTPGLHSVSTDLVSPELVESGEHFFVEYTGGDGTSAHQICGVEVEYQIPAGSSLLGAEAPDNGPATGSE